MHEFDSVSVSSFEASSRAARLTEKSRDGWEVVAIVPAGSDIVAYLKKGAAGAAAADTGVAPATDTSGVSEPAGWGSAPASTSGSSGWESSTRPAETAGSAPGSGAATWGGSAGGTQDGGSGWGAGGGQSQPAQTPAAQQTTPSVPPGWYTDPAGRYELRYWDGTAWTEHVSRAGQQYTDPPVA